MCPSFRTGDQHSLIQARLINRLADSAERIEPLLATLALVEEASNRLFDQFIAIPIVAASEFLLDLFCQIRRQRYVYDRLLSSFYALAAQYEADGRRSRRSCRNLETRKRRRGSWHCRISNKPNLLIQK